MSSWDRPVELVLVVSAGGARPEELAWLDHWLEQAQPDLERVVVFEGPRGFFIGRRTSPSATVRAYRDVVERRCGPVAMVSATEQYFAELNRWWPDLAGVDGVGFTICPQVHAADDASLMENSRGQSDPIYTARARSGGRAVHVTSMAIIGKFGPYPAGVPDVPVLSAYGDERQHELLGAAWTVSSLRQMLEAGAVSATYFELFGGRGLLRTDEDGHKCVIVPVYRVLEAVLRWRGSTVVRVGRLGGEVVGLGAEWADRSELLVANLSPDQREFELEGLAGQVTEVSELVCDHSAGAQWAQLRPDAFRADGRGQLRLTLDSYGVGRVHTS